MYTSSDRAGNAIQIQYLRGLHRRRHRQRLGRGDGQTRFGILERDGIWPHGGKRAEILQQGAGRAGDRQADGARIYRPRSDAGKNFENRYTSASNCAIMKR